MIQSLIILSCNFIKLSLTHHQSLHSFQLFQKSQLQLSLESVSECLKQSMNKLSNQDLKSNLVKNANFIVGYQKRTPWFGHLWEKNCNGKITEARWQKRYLFWPKVWGFFSDIQHCEK